MNDGDGIELEDSTSSEVLVSGGSVITGNQGNGIRVNLGSVKPVAPLAPGGSFGLTVNSSTISGNLANGVLIEDTTVEDFTVENGAVIAANTLDGVHIQDSAVSDIVVDASSLGATATLAGNGGDGFEANASTLTGIWIKDSFTNENGANGIAFIDTTLDEGTVTVGTESVKVGFAMIGAESNDNGQNGVLFRSTGGAMETATNVQFSDADLLRNGVNGAYIDGYAVDGLDIRDSRFNENGVGGAGSGLAGLGAAITDMTINESRFNTNATAGVDLSGGSLAGATDIEDSNFDDNVAGPGFRAVTDISGTVRVAQSHFDRNGDDGLDHGLAFVDQAPGTGPAAWTSLSITQVVAEMNGGSGGFLSSATIATVTISDSEFDENGAQGFATSGATLGTGGTVTVESSSFSNNTSHGWRSEFGSISNATFSGNAFDENGYTVGGMLIAAGSHGYLSHDTSHTNVLFQDLATAAAGPEGTFNGNSGSGAHFTVELTDGVLQTVTFDGIEASDNDIHGIAMDGVTATDTTVTGSLIQRNVYNGVQINGGTLTNTKILDSVLGDADLGDMVADGNGGNGLYVDSADLYGMLISGSRLDGNDGDGARFDGVTINPVPAGASAVAPGAGLEIVNSSLSGNGSDGLELDEVYASAVVVEDSAFDGNGLAGAVFSNSSVNVVDIADSSFDDNGENGMWVGDAAVFGSDALEISGSSFDGNDNGAGLLITGGATFGPNTSTLIAGPGSITDTSFDGNGGAGIEVSGAAMQNVGFDGGSMSANAGAGVVATNATLDNVSFEDTDVIENGGAGFNLGDSRLLGVTFGPGTVIAGNVGQGVNIFLAAIEDLVFDGTTIEENGDFGVRIVSRPATTGRARSCSAATPSPTT